MSMFGCVCQPLINEHDDDDDAIHMASQACSRVHRHSTQMHTAGLACYPNHATKLATRLYTLNAKKCENKR